MRYARASLMNSSVHRRSAFFFVVLKMGTNYVFLQFATRNKITSDTVRNWFFAKLPFMCRHKTTKLAHSLTQVPLLCLDDPSVS